MPTLTEYNFTQQIDYPDVLTENIQASSISVALDHIDTSGSGPSMVVSVWFKDLLSSDDQTTLNSVLSAYVNTSPSLPIPKVIQILGADTVSISPFGIMFDAPANQTTIFDVSFTRDMYLKGGIMYATPGTVGDTVSIQVIDKNNVVGHGGTPDNPTILATYVNNWFVIPQDMNAIEDVSLSQPMLSGLFARIMYANSSSSADCQVIVNFLAYVGNP